MKRVISEQAVVDEHTAGRRQISAPQAHTVITPGAWSKARELGVAFVDLNVDRGDADRLVDPSGVMVVRGASVRLGKFDGAGPGRQVGLADLVTSASGSPMTAGIMSWRREDSFPWTLDYDEVDLVLEGVLRIELEGRSLEGGPGDVFYIPKGSRIVFATPSRTRVFYVTYPADWSAPAPARPQNDIGR